MALTELSADWTAATANVRTEIALDELSVVPHAASAAAVRLLLRRLYANPLVAVQEAADPTLFHALQSVRSSQPSEQCRIAGPR